MASVLRASSPPGITAVEGFTDTQADHDRPGDAMHGGECPLNRDGTEVTLKVVARGR